MRRMTLPEILALPTLEQGHTDNLKIDSDGVRVWLSRLTTDDGAEHDNMVTVERYDPTTGRWETVDSYVPPMPPSAGEG